ncbi:MAG TPA: hypothetical protein HA257_07160 [Candidatus Methanoperedenaceae archaeon]|nr:hypothetical protein [Candidatus Methanoperedenaceae archaeon]
MLANHFTISTRLTSGTFARSSASSTAVMVSSGILHLPHERPFLVGCARRNLLNVTGTVVLASLI